ncbi:MAG: YabP/YqfC family sporulation protein [Clostridia bacterium]|nr:YabP/YqfC family sporulation protein [Clostridia bacterium]
MKVKSEIKEKAEKPHPRYRMEMEGSFHGMSVLVSGVRGIEEYAEDRITLFIAGGRMILCGNKLRLSVFENKTVEVLGGVEEVRFSDDRH